MLLCSHFKEKFGLSKDEEAYAVMSDGWRWNGWLYVYDKKGDLVYNSFVTGLMWDAVEHIQDCNEYSKRDKRWAKRLLKELQEEWEQVMS